jgi:hypothetical protein
MGGKKATTTSSVSIPPEVLARYNAVNTQAQTAAATPYEAFGKTASDYVAQLNARQNAGFNDINATAGSYQPYMTQATEATTAGLGPAYEGIDRYMSPYTKNVADTTGAFMRQQQEQAQSGALGNAISSGAFGGDRAGIAAANLQQQNQMAYGKTMADIMNQGYTQALGASQADLARQLAGGEQLAGLGAQSQQLGLQGAQAKIAAGTMEQQTEQAGKDAMINQFMQEKGYPFQVAQFLANIATGTGAASGSATTTQTPRNWLGFASGGAVEGYADGGGVAGPRTYTQSGIGGAGYVPAADLPVGQLMIADPPDQAQGSGTEDMIKLIASTMGANRGGVIDQRHGYAGGGRPQPGSIFNPVTKRWEIPAAETALALARAPVVETPPVEPTGVVAPVTRPAPPTTTSNGVIPRLRPDQQPNRGIPLLTQADYGMSEPEFKDYTSRTYSNPAEAAVGANKYYEKAGEGVGDAASIQHANRIYAAIQNGGEGLAPNELALYNHYKEKGWNDDTQIAGMIGRFNVEAGAGINPNARNTLGGGYGTYGIMQARGPRFENLAEAGGLSPADLEAMPVTHGLSSGVAGGDNLNAQTSTMTAPDEKYVGGVKPYEDRNFIGKFFHNPDGSMNQNALMSVLMGVGKAAEAQTISPLGGILSGIGGGAEAYKGLVKQQADVAQTNIENMRNIQMDTMTYNEMNGTNLTPQQYASMIGASYQIPTGIGQPIGGEKMTWGQYQNGVVQVGGRTVKMQDDPVSIQKFISDNSMFPAESPIGKQVAEARLHLNDINNSGGMTIDANGQQFQIPGYSEVGNVQAKTQADRLASAKFREEAPDVINNSGQQLAAVSTLEGVYTKMEPGKFANVGAEASAVLSALDPSNITGWGSYDLTNPAQYEIAMKGAGEIMANRLRTLPGGAPAAEIDMLQTVTPTPNMQPEAVKKLLAITKAEAQYRLDYYNQYDPAVHGNDVNAYAKKFADEGRTFKRYLEEAMASMPRFAGEGIEPTAAEAELIRRGYKRNSEGKLVKP